MSEDKASHLLPAPDPNDSQDAPKIEVGSREGLKFDVLGPMVVNTDGTLSRVANWQNMTELEKERTIRVLAARNQIRIANQEKKLQDSDTDAAPTG